MERLENALFPTTEHVDQPTQDYIGAIPNAVQQWRSENIGIKDRPISLCLVGPSRRGKTKLARSLGKHHYIMGKAMGPTAVHPDAEYIIFDDCGWKGWRDWLKPWIGGQEEISVRPLFQNRRNLRWGKPGVVCCNDLPDSIRNDDWFRSNVQVVEM